MPISASLLERKTDALIQLPNTLPYPDAFESAGDIYVRFWSWRSADTRVPRAYPSREDVLRRTPMQTMLDGRQAYFQKHCTEADLAPLRVATH